MGIVWRDKLLAFGIHFIATALLAAAAAALIFLVWYPAPFNEMIGGTKLFLLVVGCDLALGPLISLVIFNRRKSRRALVTDYSLVAALQLTALAYGVWVMAASRPVFVAFYSDRFEVVSAIDVRDTELAAARDPRYAKLPWFGPKFISVEVPAAQQQAVLFEELAGNESQMRPRFYVPYENGRDALRARAGKLEDLVRRHRDAKPLVDAGVAATGVPADRLRWLPVRARLGFWTALVDYESGWPVGYVNLDPY
jgi:hypothetical protein